MNKFFHDQRLNFFIETARDLPIQGPIGKNVFSWGKSINWSGCPLPDKQLSRSDLFAMRDTRSVSTLEFTMMICAWGGMKPKHGELFLTSWMNSPKELQKVFDGVRSGDEGDHFYQMHNLQLQKIMRGAGIAYYTKFLCFLRPQNDYFILDQWTAKSFNYLCNRMEVKIDGHTVSARNTPQTYERFCRFIHELNDELEKHDMHDNSPINTEMRLFSKGGKNALPWRDHVRKNYVSAARQFENFQRP